MAQESDSLRERFLSVKSRCDLADLLDASEERIVWHSVRSKQESRYTRITIPKKSGGERQILAPSPGLKLLQRRLNEILQEVYVSRSSAFGFIRGRNIKLNASRHANRKWVLNLDLEEFFPSINFGRIRGMFLAPPYNLPSEAATTLAQLCCHDNQLPQGAPTSPVLSNMICRSLDYELSSLAYKHNCLYSRYADDITISSIAPTFPQSIAVAETEELGGPVVLGEELQAVISKQGFRPNTSKTRLQRRNRRQVVTGLVVNQKANVPRNFVRQLRAMLHAWERYGLEAAQHRFETHYYRPEIRARFVNVPRYEDVIAGKLAYLKFIRGRTDDLYIKFERWFRRLHPNF